MAVSSTSARIVRLRGGRREERADAVAVEAPLTIAVDGEVVVTTMRTPGHDLELAAGWLVNESGVRDAQGISAMGAFSARDDDTVDTVRVSLAPGVTPPRPRAFVTTAACGVCSADVIAAAPPPAGPLRSALWSLEFASLPATLGRMRDQQHAFDRTGSLHAAAIVDPDGALTVREDVGRHNAVDKAVGRMLLDGALPLTDHLLLVSGRVSYEIVHKALTAGVAGIVAVSGPTSLAVDLARRTGLVLVGFARGEGANVYAGEQWVR